MKPSKQPHKFDQAGGGDNGSPSSNRSGTSYQGSLPTQTVQKGGIPDMEVNISRTNHSTHHRHSRHRTTFEKGAISLETGRDNHQKGFSNYLEAADEHLARGSVELAFLGYSQGNFLLHQLLRRSARNSLKTA